MGDEIRAKAEEAIKDLLVVKCMENCQRITVSQIILALEMAGLTIVPAGYSSQSAAIGALKP